MTQPAPSIHSDLYILLCVHIHWSISVHLYTSVHTYIHTYIHTMCTLIEQVYIYVTVELADCMAKVGKHLPTLVSFHLHMQSLAMAGTPLFSETQPSSITPILILFEEFYSLLTLITLLFQEFDMIFGLTPCSL